MTDALKTARPGVRVRSGNPVVTILRRREASLVLALALITVGVSSVAPRFLSLDNFGQILAAVVVVTVVGVGQALVVISGNVDLSVGSVVGLTAFVAATTAHANQSLPLLIVFLMAMAIGAACGAINGLLVTVGRIPAIVVTLGTLYVFRGVDYIIAGGGQVNAAELPSSFLDFPSQKLLGIPLTIVLTVVLVAVFAAGARWLRVGRYLYATGNSSEAAHLAGLPQRRTVFGAFVLCGALAGVAGVLYATRFGAVTSSAGLGLEFQVVAAVVVGGVSILGGSGSIIGSVLGAILFGVITNALNVMNAPSNWIQAISGAAILLAIILDLAMSRARERRERFDRERAKLS